VAEKILFLTGKLAENSLNRVLENMPSKQFEAQVLNIGVSVAALMTPQMILRRVAKVANADKIIVPGLCVGNLNELEQYYGVPVLKGPIDLKDLPQFFGHERQTTDLSQYATSIFAEIVDAPFLTVEKILERAEIFRAQGANVIDLGCLQNTPFAHLERSIQALQARDFVVSVDSLNHEELLRAGQAGANFLLSLNVDSLWIAKEVDSIPVLIPKKSSQITSLYRAIEQMQAWDKPFIADPILEPIPFGFTDSILRYQRLRKRYPKINIMMGVGNLTELTDADTTGINALLFGIISELNINAVLTTSVSPHACNAIAEADSARRTMFAAKQDSRLPRGYSNELLGLHDRKPFPYNKDEIESFVGMIKDPNFRIQVCEEGIMIYNRDGLRQDIDPFRLYPHLNVDDDASHAFYLGVELARAQIAWQLKKRYVQDEELAWGVNTVNSDLRGKVAHRERTMKGKKK
jgi:dihydropteroate synthase-like protein